MNFENLKINDPICYKLVKEEIERQETSLELIPSECSASLATIEALGSPFTNKYSEWYPKKRYYWWNDIVDEVELLAIQRTKEVFPWVEYVNVQAYSWSPANLAIYNAICNVWDTIMWLALSQWWHLTHWHNVSASSKFFKSIQYGLDERGYINLEEVEKLALEHKPKIIIIWTTAYSRELPFKEFQEIAKKVDAYLVADISHISGLVVSWLHISPVNYADVIMTTTHKTLRWPRWALIMTTKKGLEKDSELASKIDKSIFPWLQWWPHNHQTLSIAVALWEALSQEFRNINSQIIKNAKTLAEELKKYGFDIATWWTDNHLILAWVWKWRWLFMQEALDKAGITLNRNTIPNEPCSPFNPSWIRLWTPVMTMRGMKEKEAIKIATWIKRVSDEIKDFVYAVDKEQRKKLLIEFNQFIQKNTEIIEIRKEVKDLCLKFPIYKY